MGGRNVEKNREVMVGYRTSLARIRALCVQVIQAQERQFSGEVSTSDVVFLGEKDPPLTILLRLSQVLGKLMSLEKELDTWCSSQGVEEMPASEEDQEILARFITRHADGSFDEMDVDTV